MLVRLNGLIILLLIGGSVCGRVSRAWASTPFVDSERFHAVIQEPGGGTLRDTMLLFSK